MLGLLAASPLTLSSVALLQCGCMTVFRRRLIITSSLTCECCPSPLITAAVTSQLRTVVCVCAPFTPLQHMVSFAPFPPFRVTGGELFEDIVAREYYSEADAR